MNRQLLFQRMTSDAQAHTVHWDFDARTTVERYRDLEDGEFVEKYEYPREAIVDAWCETSTRVEIVYKGTGKVQRREVFNSPLCEITPCGLKIDSVTVTGTELAGPNATATIHISGYGGAVEYSLNNFADTQDSNVFTGLSVGSYIAYVRAIGDGRCMASYPFEVLPDYKVRWRVPYYTMQGTAAWVDIEDRSWTGDIEYLNGGKDPVSVEYPPIGDKVGVFGGSGLSLHILVHREGLLLDMYTADERKFRVSHYEGGALIWRGYLLPEFYEEAWLDVKGNPSARLTASDGIATLSEVYYLLDNGQRYYGRESLHNILFNCLDKLDLGLPFYTSVNIWADGMDREADPLTQAFVNQAAYYKEEPLTCGDVLERILNPFGCFIRQWGGALHVIPHHARKGPYFRRKYDAQGNFLSSEVFEQLDMILADGEVSYRLGSQVVGMRPAITLGRVIVEYGEMESFVENGSFEDWDGDKPRHWDGTATVQRGIADDGDSFMLRLTGGQPSLTTATYLESSLYDVSGLEIALNLSFDYKLTYDPSQTTVDLIMQVFCGGKYAHKSVGGNYSFEDGSANIVVLREPMADAGGIQEKSGKVEIKITGVPQDGPVRVRIWQPIANAAANLVYEIDNLKVTPYTTDTFTKMQVEGANPGYNTVKPFSLTLYHGSGIARSEALVSLADHTPTKLWESEFLLQEITLREILSQHENPTRLLRATLTNASAIGVVKDLHMPGTRFGIDGYTLNHRTGMAQVEAYELFHGPEALPPQDAIITEDGRPIVTENYNWVVKEN